MSAQGGGSPVEAYLDELVRRSSGLPARELRTLLAEAEAHLRDATAAGVADGMAESDAERAAVERFGEPALIAAAERSRTRQPVGVIVRTGLWVATALGAVGAIAVGISGVIALIVRLVGGIHAVVDVAPGTTLSPGDCARWLSQAPASTSCRAAAVADWVGEIVWYRIALGVLGVIVLVAVRAATRSTRLSWSMEVVRDTVATSAFGVGFVATFLQGIDALVVGGGPGQWFSATPVALVGTLFFGRRLVELVRTNNTVVPRARLV